MIDDDIVAIAAAGPASYLHIAAGGRIDGRPRGGGKVGASVELVDAGNRVLAPAVLTGDAGIALERADEAGKAQLGLRRRGRGDQLLDLFLDGLVVHLIGLDGRLGILLGFLGLSRTQLGFPDAGIQLVLLGLHLAVLGVQLGLFALELGAFLFQRSLIVLERLFGVLHVVEDLGVFNGDILHHFIERQQLVQVVHRGQHGHAAAVPQLLHGGHVLLEAVPLVRDLRFLGGDLRFLGGDLLLLDADAVLHIGDLALEHADLPLDDRDLFFQVGLQLLGGGLFLLGIREFFFVLLNGLRELVELVLQ